MINNSAVLATTYAEEAGLDARFRSTKQNSTDRATQAEESAHQAAQTGYQHGYRPSDSRTFTPPNCSRAPEETSSPRRPP